MHFKTSCLKPQFSEMLYFVQNTHHIYVLYQNQRTQKWSRSSEKGGWTPTIVAKTVILGWIPRYIYRDIRLKPRAHKALLFSKILCWHLPNKNSWSQYFRYEVGNMVPSVNINEEGFVYNDDIYSPQEHNCSCSLCQRVHWPIRTL